LLAAACGSAVHMPSVKAPPTTATTSTTTTTTVPPAEKIGPATAPAGFNVSGAQWIKFTRPDGKQQTAAIFRPAKAATAAPVIVLLHGSSGLARIQLDLAKRLAHAGFVVLAGCYLDATPSPTLLVMPCAGLPNNNSETEANVRPGYKALLDVATHIKGVDPAKLGVLGISLGANVALTGDDPRVKAIVADSGFRDGGGVTKQPVLLLGMLGDPNVPHAQVAAFEQAQRRAGRPVQFHYYPGASHVTLFSAPNVAKDAYFRTLAFLRHQLAP
jgi:dienelactone hydrolase